MPKPVKKTTTEVVATPDNNRRQRRKFTTEQKLRIIKEADAATERGQVGALLRREGLYSSQLTMWRRHFRSGGVDGLTAKKPGRKGKDERDVIIDELKKRNARLEKEVRIQRGLLDLQKKAHEILGIALPRVDDEEMTDLQNSSASGNQESR